MLGSPKGEDTPLPQLLQSAATAVHPRRAALRPQGDWEWDLAVNGHPRETPQFVIQMRKLSSRNTEA